MREHVVQAGETLATIAARYKLPPSLIWETRDNEDLRRLRVYADALVQDDKLVIPDFVTRTVPGTTGRQLDLAMQASIPRYRLQLLVDGEPCRTGGIVVGDQFYGVNEDGRVEFDLPPCPTGTTYPLIAYLPARSRAPKLEERVRILKVRTGSPYNELDLVQGLLTNLGFHCDNLRPGAKNNKTDWFPPRTHRAFLRFRRVFGLSDEGASRDGTFRSLEYLEMFHRHALEALFRIHSQEACQVPRFFLGDKLCRLMTPVHHLFIGPAWNRINILEGPEIIVDAHMHINSGRYAALPLVWDKKTALKIVRWNRAQISAFVPMLTDAGTTEFVRLGAQDTSAVAARSVSDNADTMRTLPHFDRDYLSILVAMPMDMDFAHIDGYRGQQLYKPRDYVETPVTLHGFTALAKEPGLSFTYSEYLPVEDGDITPVTATVDNTEAEEYQPYAIQVADTLQAAAAHPWSVLPLYHYDPRRWNLGSNEEPPPSRTYTYRAKDKHTGELIQRSKAFDGAPRPWTEPFDKYFLQPGPRPFIGMKLYTALGYRPLDPRLRYQNAFYKRCTELQLPIVCHCTPGGMFSLERPLYVVDQIGPRPEDAALRAARNATLEALRTLTISKFEERARSYRIDLLLESVDAKSAEKWSKYIKELHDDVEWGSYWFSETYVSPWAWYAVLSAHPTLRLCLAHLGGDEVPYSHWSRHRPPKVRTDLNEKFTDSDTRLLWDDQLIKLALSYDHVYFDLSYFQLTEARLERFASIFETYPKLLDRALFGTDWYMIELSNMSYSDLVTPNRKFLDRINPEWWERFTCVNPARFYRFRENAEAIAEALRVPPPSVKQPRATDKAKRLADIERGMEKFKSLDAEFVP